MNNPTLRFRQIHLDFHTSQHISNIGAQFDPAEFAAILAQAHVDSITCFARCHHGWMYYDTTMFPERKHPHLSRNLLKEQINACHAHNIRVPIYITVQWDHYTANKHPEWLVVDENGCPINTSLYEAGFYRSLCVNSPYVDFLKAHTQEVLQTLPSDGIFFDIVQPLDCSCRYCQALLNQQGLDPADAAVRRAFGLQSINTFKQTMTTFVRQFNKDCTIFYNAGHVGPRHREVAGAYTHFELESLPSGGWGYLHFPLAMRYARNLGLDCLGMTGKFHTSWGDFHSFKNPAALQFECFQMLALNAKCSIGDQLAPAGKIDPDVYHLIGSVYAELEKKEPWCRAATPLTDIGVFTPEEFYEAGIGRLSPALMGITRMLEESAHQFDILDSHSNLTPYKVVILPDNIPVSEDFAAKLNDYLKGGGALIASFAAGMDTHQEEFILKTLGVTLNSTGPRDRHGELVRGRFFERGDYVEYILPQGPIGQGLPQTEHVMYMHGMDVQAAAGADVLAHNIPPYFDRTYRHFCSHRQTPSSGEVGSPAIIKKEQTIYFAHPIFTEYDQIAPRWGKVLFLNALKMFLPEPLVTHNGPSTLKITVNEQADENRRVVHLLHYIPERRSQLIDIIEDVIPLYNVRVSVRISQQVKTVQLVPEEEVLDFSSTHNRVEFIVPKLAGHQMVTLHY